MCNYSKELLSYLKGQQSISSIARSLIDSGKQMEQEMVNLADSIQTLYDTGKLDAKKVQSINAGLQRETKLYSREQFDTENKIGCKVDKDDNVTVGIVKHSRKRGVANKPKTQVAASKVSSLTECVDLVVHLCAGFTPAQKADVLKMFKAAIDKA